ncbi:MAG: TetR/AcrR family transcriptional regulator [Eubacteriales bacterium]
MNEKFFTLPEKKQLAILNAGYRVFSQNCYKKSPVSEIAAEAGISKSLLFHYFRNKRELYLFLIRKAVDTTYEYLAAYGCNGGEEDIFELMHRGLRAKVALMKKYPELTLFSIRAYYETDPEVCADIQEIIGHTVSLQANTALLNTAPERYREGLNLQMMYMDMYLASEGYLWEKSQRGRPDADEVEKDFEKMIEFWKTVYLREE